jgi:hypothetical protein
MTKNGVVYNLLMSPFVVQTHDVKFVFSSKSHKDKFKEKIDSNRNNLNDKLTKKYGIDVDVSLLADIVLYTMIETRGFLIFDKEGKPLCKNDIVLNGATLMKKPSIEQSEILMQR